MDWFGVKDQMKKHQETKGDIHSEWHSPKGKALTHERVWVKNEFMENSVEYFSQLSSKMIS